MRRWTPILLAVAAGLLSAGPAYGAETIGQARPAGPACAQTGPDTIIQITSQNNRYAAPFDGVITSWLNTGAWRSPTFKVARLGPGNSFTVLASDGPRTLTSPGVAERHPIRVPVRQGDVIGAHKPFAFHSCDYQTGDPADLWGVAENEDPSVGATSTFDRTGNATVPLEATIERDRDADGFGDETQDECPTNAATQGPCPLPTVLGTTDFLPPGGGGSANADFIATNLLEGKVSAPADGVVTSWSYKAGPFVNGTVKVKMFRPLGGDDYRVVGSGQAQAPTANVLNIFPARIAVREGDKIGVHANGVPVVSNFSSSGNTLAIAPGDLGDGETATFTPANNRMLNIAAVVEADLDNDGFGDTSQDQCPTDASTQAACTVPPPDGDDACEKARKKLAKAKAKLKQLKQKQAAAKKVKEAKAAVRKAC